jgi:DNA end-binding protein Ku
MRSIWKGTISFGLVNVPITLYPATAREEMKFRLLRAGDLSPVNYRRVAETDGKVVSWDEIVKGYEYEKGKFVVLKDEDFRRVDLEATQTVDIIDFVPLADINPIYFHKPFHMEPGKGGGKAYALLRDALRRTGRVGVAKVVIRTRQYLAAVKPNGKGLILELMHFADELVEPRQPKVRVRSEPTKVELEMAEALIERMSSPWDPSRYLDDYRVALLNLIDRKVKAGGAEAPQPLARPRPVTNVINLVDVLRQSLEEPKSRPREKTKSPRRASPKGPRAA